MHPKVSIIVPVYNVKRYLEQCLDSVLAQTYGDFELICIDDGSTDGSSALLDEYRARDERIKVFGQENAGLSAARNAGIGHSQGDYLVFLDSDDWWAPNMLEVTVNALDQTDADFVVFDYWLYFDGVSTIGTYRDQKLFDRLDGKVFDLASCPEMASFIGVWDRLYKRSFIDRYHLRFADGMIYEDVPFCIDSLINAERITLVSDHLYYYRRGVKGSITGAESESAKHKEDFLAVQSYAQSRFAEAGVGLDVWRSYARYFMEYSEMHLRQIPPGKFFDEFYVCVRDMALGGQDKPNLARFGASDPERAIYQLLLDLGSPLGELLYLKSMNKLRRQAHRIRVGLHAAANA